MPAEKNAQTYKIGSAEKLSNIWKIMNYANILMKKCKKNKGFFQKVLHLYHSIKMCFRSTEAPAFFNQCQVRYMMSYKLQKIWWRARHKFFSIAVLRWKILTKLSGIFSNAWCGRNILDLTLIQFEVFILPTRQAGSFAKNVHRTFS